MTTEPDPEPAEDEPRGLGVEDLPGILREEYLHAIETARALHDPTLDWEGFRETLWRHLVHIFEIEAESAGETD